MFMRFVVTQIHQASHQPQGLFITAYRLLETGDLIEAEQEELRLLLRWFETHLTVPNHPYVKGRAVFWYKSSALECIKRMWELTNILRSHGFAVELQTCQALGNKMHQDEYQVAAYPSHRDAKIITKQV